MTNIATVSAATGTTEVVALTAEELAEIEAQQISSTEMQIKALNTELAVSDTYMARMCEDLINILVANGTIALTDFSQAAQDKLTERAQIRTDIAALEE